jgi:acyl-CoA synthetase (AMP-forming)/AMP-acid ligase II
MTVVVPARDVQQRAEAAAGALAARGVRPGDRVAITTPEHQGTATDAAAAQADTLAIVLGCLRSAVMPVLINPQLTAQERAYVLADAEPALTLTTPGELAALLRGPRADVDLADHPLSRPMHYTSGTTGRPKGVWTGDLTEHQARDLWADEQALWRFTPDDLSLVHGPLCHSGPLRFALAVVLAGGSVALPGWFDAAACARDLAALRPTTAFVVPSHLQRLFALPDRPPSPYRLLAHAGAACPAPLKERTHAWAGAERVWEFYGATEGQFAACSGPDWEQHRGTVGRARDGRRLQIRDGVIWCHAPSFARFSYWRDPAKTAAAWDGEAFSVGDLGRLDDDGYLYLDGRRDDLIITGGVNVYPAEVEAVLSACPGVSEAAVYGRSDERWGQAVHAVYLGSAEPAAVSAWAAARLAAYKRPKSVQRRTDLPRTASGKVKRLELADS